MRPKKLSKVYTGNMYKVMPEECKLTLTVKISLPFFQWYGQKPLEFGKFKPTLDQFLLDRLSDAIFSADIGADIVSMPEFKADETLKNEFKRYAENLKRFSDEEKAKKNKEEIEALEKRLKELKG